MGNGDSVSKSSLIGKFKEFEHLSGKKLLAAIRSDNEDGASDAIEFARQEYIKPVAGSMAKASNLSGYEDMTKGMVAYLTREYDVGDGIVFKQTPLEYARAKKAKKVEQIIEKSILDLERLMGINAAKTSYSVGEVTKERVEEAKARLQAIRDTRKKSNS